MSIDADRIIAEEKLRYQTQKECLKSDIGDTGMIIAGLVLLYGMTMLVLTFSYNLIYRLLSWSCPSEGSEEGVLEAEPVEDTTKFRGTEHLR